MTTTPTHDPDRPERKHAAMTLTLSPERLATREALVIEHMQSENVQQWDRTMATFSHARYELPDGTVIDGTDAVLDYWRTGRTRIPDQRNELIELTHVDDRHTQIEFWLRGTSARSGRTFETRLWAVFSFDDDDLMTNERAYTQPPTADQVAGRVTTDGRTVSAEQP